MLASHFIKEHSNFKNNTNVILINRFKSKIL
jgi:hypothetical protein